MSAPKAAAALGLGAKQVREAVRTGELAGACIGGRYYVARAVVDAFERGIVLDVG